jgi:serine/threonine protein kinase
MAPEILRSEKYEVSSDLWSVGCILYQCLVGRAPFVVSTHFELLKRLEKEDAVIPPEIRSQISPECFDLVMSLLDKNRDTRIAWESYFRHAWFGSSSSSSSDLSALSTSSSSSGGVQWPMEGPVKNKRKEKKYFVVYNETKLAPGTILARHEARGHRHRVVDRALAVLELADMKTDHGRKEEAAVLYKKVIFVHCRTFGAVFVPLFVFIKNYNEFELYL